VEGVAVAVIDPLAEYGELVRGRQFDIGTILVAVREEGLSLELTVAESGSTDTSAATVRFDRIVDLAVRQASDGFPLGIQIVSMADDGWEDVAYKVTDPEYGILSFYCAEIRVTRLDHP
jgi:hypothetical protein